MKINHEHHELFQRAYAAGMDALNAAVPVPMRIVEADIWGKPKAGSQVWVEPEGMCGFAWVRIKGNTGFARTMKSMGFFRKAWDRGFEFWVSEGGQSVERKEAFARAFAKVLRDGGVDAYADSRLD